MNADFSRTLALVRQEKGLSQRKVAKDLGVSQALLSHYENGVREPGLEFVKKACDYYHISADYLLGRTLSKDGGMIEVEALYDSSEEKGTLRGNIAATLQKKLVANSSNLLFDLLGRTGSREAVLAAGGYLNGALYQLYRTLHRAAGENGEFFALDAEAFASGAVQAQMRMSVLRYAAALRTQESFPAMDADSIQTNYPGLSQSLTQVLHTVDEQTNTLLEG
ncbi:MAG: helix-turn-helix transcriptional regulator [Oscillospiraceae bacterium]|nr:helix-turn-helix transcriptional regulator [Oscillospiraceae bacterium]